MNYPSTLPWDGVTPQAIKAEMRTIQRNTYLDTEELLESIDPPNDPSVMRPSGCESSSLLALFK